MKHLTTISYCASLQGKQPVPAFWHNLSLENATSMNSIRGTADLESEGWDD